MQTRLEIQALKLPDTSPVAVPSTPSEQPDSVSRFRPHQFPPCTHVASFRFPGFTHQWHNPGPSVDEVLPVEGGQSFRLLHSSIAAKPSPGPNGLGDDQGLLCITIEGDFGPVTHPDEGDAHDHGCIAFCTIAGALFNNRIFNTAPEQQPKIVDYKDWHRGHVSWEFGPGNTWVTGFGTRTTSVSRFMGFTNEAEGDELVMPNPDTAKRSTIVSVRLRNYDPVAVLRQGRVSHRPLGRAPSSTEGDVPHTGILDRQERVAAFGDTLNTEGMLNLVELSRRIQAEAALAATAAAAGGGPVPILPPMDDLTNLFASMAASTSDTFRVINHTKTKLPEMFSDVTLENSLPYYEANVAIHLDEEGRSEAAMEHPFKTILGRDRLIVCDVSPLHFRVECELDADVTGRRLRRLLLLARMMASSQCVLIIVSHHLKHVSSTHRTMLVEAYLSSYV